MLVGHHAVGFAAKRVAPSVSLGTLQLASVFLDLIVFVDQLAGIEHAHHRTIHAEMLNTPDIPVLKQAKAEYAQLQ